MSLLYALPLVGSYEEYRNRERQNRFLKEKISSNPHLEQEGLRGAICHPLQTTILKELLFDIIYGCGAIIIYTGSKILDLHGAEADIVAKTQLAVGSIAIFGGMVGNIAYRSSASSIIRNYEKYGKATAVVEVDSPVGLDIFGFPISRRKTIEII